MTVPHENASAGSPGGKGAAPPDAVTPDHNVELGMNVSVPPYCSICRAPIKYVPGEGWVHYVEVGPIDLPRPEAMPYQPLDAPPPGHTAHLAVHHLDSGGRHICATCQKPIEYLATTEALQWVHSAPRLAETMPVALPPTPHQAAPRPDMQPGDPIICRYCHMPITRKYDNWVHAKPNREPTDTPRPSDMRPGREGDADLDRLRMRRDDLRAAIGVLEDVWEQADAGTDPLDEELGTTVRDALDKARDRLGLLNIQIEDFENPPVSTGMDPTRPVETPAVTRRWLLTADNQTMKFGAEGITRPPQVTVYVSTGAYGRWTECPPHHKDWYPGEDKLTTVFRVPAVINLPAPCVVVVVW